MRDLKELTGYDIITEEKIPEVNGTGYILSHKKTKARVLVIANDGKSITVIEQTSGNGGQFVPCKCSYCDNDTTLKSLGTRQITYTYSYLYNDGYKVIRRYKECMDGTETDEWGWEKDR